LAGTVGQATGEDDMQVWALAVFLFNEVVGPILQAWAFSAVAFLLIYVVFARFFKRRKIQDRPFDWRQFGHEVVFSILTVGAGTLIGKAIGFLVDGGHASISKEPFSAMVLGRILLQFAIYFFLFDLYFYVLHRLMHTDLMYWIHKHHHRSTAPDPLTAFSFHPIEGLLTGGFLVLMVYFFHLHLYAIIAVNTYGMLNSVLVHSGHEAFPSWWYRSKISKYYISPMYHDRHHSLYRYNFGGFTNIWDRLFGTMDPDFDAAYDELQKKAREKTLASAAVPAE
jgi:Delta7-sterol 5-desaturase